VLYLQSNIHVAVFFVLQGASHQKKVSTACFCHFGTSGRAAIVVALDLTA